jgi:hypothetical protein
MEGKFNMPSTVHHQIHKVDLKNKLYLYNKNWILTKTLILLLSAYYAFDTLCLPMGNFSALKELPGMYRHCKATEDKDMTPFDFLTDHLVNIDGIFDKHDHGDRQKPHNALPIHCPQTQIFCLMTFPCFSLPKPLELEKLIINYADKNYHLDFISGIFRPPII